MAARIGANRIDLLLAIQKKSSRDYWNSKVVTPNTDFDKKNAHVCIVGSIFNSRQKLCDFRFRVFHFFLRCMQHTHATYV